jgi:hypothetical protein
MTMPTIELRCDSCAEARFLYRLHGTEAALCSGCFIDLYTPDSAYQHRQRRVRTSGPAAAGCLRTMRVAPAAAGVHRRLGRTSR